eukprot:2964714-Rhodomonas_salina.1
MLDAFPDGSAACDLVSHSLCQRARPLSVSVLRSVSVRAALVLAVCASERQDQVVEAYECACCVGVCCSQAPQEMSQLEWIGETPPGIARDFKSDATCYDGLTRRLRLRV